MYSKLGIWSYGDEILRDRWDKKYGAVIGWLAIATIALAIFLLTR